MRRRSLFEPDFSSTTTFTRFSVTPCSAIPASSQRQHPISSSSSSLSTSSSLLPIKQQKHVQFSPSNKNQVYWIQRRDSQRVSVRTEAVLNRIAIMQSQIQKKRDELHILEKFESKLIIQCDAEKARLSLEKRIHQFDHDIETMRNDTMHLKSETKQMLAVVALRLRDQDAAKVKNISVLSKRSLDLMDFLLLQVGSVFSSEGGSRTRPHMSSPESKEPTARCA